MKTAGDSIIINSTNVGGSYDLMHPEPLFDWWSFSTTVPVASSIAFDVEIIDGDVSRMETNGGQSYGVQTQVVPQTSLSCSAENRSGPSKVQITAAIQDKSDFELVTLSVDVPIAQPGSVTPEFEKQTAAMIVTGSVKNSRYSLYAGEISFGPTFKIAVLYDVIGTTKAGGTVGAFGWTSDIPSCALTWALHPLVLRS
ncbi:hypothetical protein GGR57DRAFT_517105 [Xylariaceae sp. FL1272]|nr:hypothetical protein GGR57DRAFT_517105 [Xylariaceae sp. FL1272]